MAKKTGENKKNVNPTNNIPEIFLEKVVEKGIDGIYELLEYLIKKISNNQVPDTKTEGLNALSEEMKNSSEEVKQLLIKMSQNQEDFKNGYVTDISELKEFKSIIGENLLSNNSFKHLLETVLLNQEVFKNKHDADIQELMKCKDILEKIEKENSKTTFLSKETHELHEKSERNRFWRKTIIWGCTLSLLTILFLVSFRPRNQQEAINDIDSTLIQRIFEQDSLYFHNIQSDLRIEFNKFDTLNSIYNTKNRNYNTLYKDQKEFENKVMSSIESRNKFFINEMERQHNSLLRNSVYINLVGRYGIIICLIVAFVVSIRVISGSRFKDDYFE
jgi:hypothetical protein